MSADWELRLACDECGAVTDEGINAKPGHHGAALAVLRAGSARAGWLVWSGNTRPRRDYCPKCAAPRGHGA